jgi:hypothetical protein
MKNMWVQELFPPFRKLIVLNRTNLYVICNKVVRSDMLTAVTMKNADL